MKIKFLDSFPTVQSMAVFQQFDEGKTIDNEQNYVFLKYFFYFLKNFLFIAYEDFTRKSEFDAAHIF